MENPEIISPERRVTRSRSRVEDLHLDHVVASQPEMGPTPPDGGYGWLIVFSAVIYQITVPSLISLYGLIILKAIREEDRDEGESMKIWDVDVALVPVIMTVIRLLLESWCRAVVKIFNMPRLMALSGLCLTVAGVLLSSFSTDANSNDHIINIFAGIFAGAGCALTGQQTEVIITNYFREKLTMAQRIVRMAPSLGNCITPLLVGYLLTVHMGDAVVMIYAAILMQNCLFLASYTRPIYIEKVIRTTYNKLRDAVEDDDEEIFSNTSISNRNIIENQTVASVGTSNPAHDDEADVVVFKSKRNAKEIFDPSIEYIENINQRRFSNDFTTSPQNPGNRFSSDFTATSNRFSSDFGAYDISSFGHVTGYQELRNIDRENPPPEPLYRETTENAPIDSIVFPTEVSPGTARRTASLQKNLITVKNMLLDANFYLYTLLHLCTTFSILILGMIFPPFIWEQNSSMNIWGVSMLTAVAHASALCFIALCIVMPKSINQKSRLCAGFCVAGAVGFYGVTLTGNRGLLVVWGMCASFAVSASSILQQPLYNSTLNEFDTTATATAANAIVAVFLLVWALCRNYAYRTCFLTASFIQVITSVVFFLSSFRKR